MRRAANGRSTVYLGGDARWHGRVSMGVGPDGRPDRRHVSASTKRAVTAKVRSLEHARTSGRVTAGSVPTLEGWLEHWLERIAGPSVRPKTLAGYRTAVRKHLVPLLGGHRLDKLTPELIENAYARMVIKEAAPATVHQAHRTLRTALTHAVERGRITVNPAAIARAPRIETREVVPLSVAEARTVLEACTSFPNGVRYALGLALGLRQGEALGLVWADLDLTPAGGPPTLSLRRALQRQTWQHGCPRNDACREHRAGSCANRHGGGLVLVPPKSAAARRTVVIPAPLVQDLKAHRQARRRRALRHGRPWSETDLVFVELDGRPIDPRTDLAGWHTLLQEAGVRPVRLHDARHTAATLMLIQGIDARTVMTTLGWTHSRMADQYQHVADELRVTAAGKISALLWPEDPPVGVSISGRPRTEARTETRKRTLPRPPRTG